MTDLSPALLKAARALAGWTQEELGERAGLSRDPIAGFESGRASLAHTDKRDIIKALEAANVVFINDGVVRR